MAYEKFLSEHHNYFFFFLVKWNVRDKTPEKEGSLTTFLSQF